MLQCARVAVGSRPGGPIVEGFDARTPELLDVLSRYEGKRLFVAVIGSPDPDGLASAWTLKMLARCVGVTMDILTFEILSRPDNIAFCQMLEIPFKYVDKLPRVGYAGYCVVDRQNARLPIGYTRKLPLVAHIDHHVEIPTGAMFAQQDPIFGSTSSMMAYHLKYIGEHFDLDASEVCRSATALMFGVRTDTQNFLTAKSQDYEAAAILAPLASTELIRTLVNTPVGRPFINTLAVALGSRQTRSGLTIAFAGPVAKSARDTIGQTADFLIRGDKTVAIIVYGVVDDYIVGSMRTIDADLETFVFIDESLSKIFPFPIDCGGRTFSGGFQIPLKLIPDEDISVTKRKIDDSFLKVWTSSGRGRRSSSGWSRRRISTL